MSKFILFTAEGDLVTRYDSDIHGEDIPPEALEIPDALFWQTINETDGVWKRQNGEIVKVPFPAPTIENIRADMQATAFQAHAAIARQGLYQQVEALMIDPETPFEVRLAWQKAQTFSRLSPAIVSMGAALGLSDTQLDDLFTLAATIEA